jgi:hypothetical protein
VGTRVLEHDAFDAVHEPVLVGREARQLPRAAIDHALGLVDPVATLRDLRHEVIAWMDVLCASLLELLLGGRQARLALGQPARPKLQASLQRLLGHIGTSRGRSGGPPGGAVLGSHMSAGSSPRPAFAR